MQIVINIPKGYYDAIKAIPDTQCDADMLIIKYGTPLPKGHGRLIDCKDLINRLCTDDASEFFGSVTCGEIIDFVDGGSQTIIEADKVVEE